MNKVRKGSDGTMHIFTCDGWLPMTEENRNRAIEFPFVDTCNSWREDWDAARDRNQTRGEVWEAKTGVVDHMQQEPSGSRTRRY